MNLPYSRWLAGCVALMLLATLIDGVAARRPDHPALVDGDRTLTYAELQAARDRVAGALATAGLAPGDRLAVLSPNCAELEIGRAHV